MNIKLVWIGKADTLQHVGRCRSDNSLLMRAYRFPEWATCKKFYWRW